MSAEVCRTVLVVDDEAAHRRACARALRGVAAVVTATDAHAAEALLERTPVALVVSDQRMPRRSGIELLESVRRRYPDTILVLLTAYADVAVMESAINRVALYHFVEKPWRVRELRQVVARGLERYALEAQRRRLVMDLRAAAEGAANEARFKNRLLALLAHELGTPVHIAINAVGLLRESVPPPALPWLDALQRSSDWLARSVSQIQRSSLASAEPLRRLDDEVDVVDLVAVLASDLRRAADRRELAIEQRASAGSVVRGDPFWLREAVWNLLTNAARSTPDGGRIEVAVERQAGCAVICVDDSGIGGAEGALRAASDPYAPARSDPVLHGSGWLDFGARGLGLGLNLARRIAESHGGALSAQSSRLGGSRFAMSLPVAAVPGPIREIVAGRAAGR